MKCGLTLQRKCIQNRKRPEQPVRVGLKERGTSMMEKVKKKNEGAGWDTGFHSEEGSSGVALGSVPLTI